MVTFNTPAYQGLPLFLETIGFFAAAMAFAYLYFRLSKQGFKGHVPELAGVNSVIYSIQALLSLMWATGAVTYSPSDFLLFRAIFSVIQAAIALFIVYSMTESKSIIFLLLLFLASSIPLRTDITLFFAMMALTSYILILIVIGDIMIFHPQKGNAKLRLAAIFGAFYAFSSISSFVLFFFLGIALSAFLFPLQNLALAASLFFFITGFEHTGSKAKQAVARKNVSLPLLFARYSVFVIGICAFIFLSTISIHELGHTLAAQMSGCQAKTIIYANAENPHTEFICLGNYSNELITVAGILLPIIVAVLFMLTKEPLIIKMAYLIMGFNLFISFRDLKELYVSESAIFLIISLSVITILFAIIRLSVYYLYQQASFYFFHKES